MLGLILLTLFLVFLNGFFVAAEFAIVKVRASQLEVKAKQGNRFAVLSKHIVTHLDGYLAATQLGITLASLGLGWIGEPVVSKLIIKIVHLFGVEIEEELAHQIALPVAFAIITVLHIVFGELAPKSMAIQHSEKTTLVVSYPLQFFFIIFRPFIWVLNGVAGLVLKMFGMTASHETEVHSNDELKFLMQQGKESGEIEASDYDIIKNAFNFSERKAHQIMVPRIQLFAVDLAAFKPEDANRLILEGYSRIPLYEKDLDNIVGVAFAKEVLAAMQSGNQVDLRALMHPIMSVPESKELGPLLKEFQQTKRQIAVVINEYGGTEGIVTMEDILEELVGEIQDEWDDEFSFVSQIDDKSFQIQANISLEKINELLPKPLPLSTEYETMAGFIIETMGRIPGVGEKCEAEGYEFTVTHKQRRTILQVKATLLGA